MKFIMIVQTENGRFRYTLPVLRGLAIFGDLRGFAAFYPSCRAWRYVLNLSVVCIFAVAVMPNAAAGNRPCTKEEAIAAEAVAATANTWEQLYQQFVHYGHCDDGAIAEGFDETVTRLLAEQWSSVHVLGAVSEADPAFRKFVIRHIDQTVPAERLAHIRKNVTTQCPSRFKKLCRDIELACVSSRGLGGTK